MKGAYPRPAAIFKKDLPDPGTRRFHFHHKGRRWEGVLIHHQGRYYAYLNECRHVPVQLDLSGGGFFTADRKQLQCQSHGAIFEIPTGLCVDGPCVGKSLWRLEVVEEEAGVTVYVPEGFHVGSGPQ